MATAALHLDRATAVARRREAARVRGRRRLAGLGLAVAAVAVAAAYLVLLHSSVFAVRQVTVHGGPAALDAEVAQAARAAVGGQNLLQLNPAAVARRIERIPFVLRAHIDRAFPNTLAVTITRDRPAVYARVGHSGYLIAADGRVLASVAARPAHLPALYLPASTAIPAPGVRAGDAAIHSLLVLLAARPPTSRGLGPLVRAYSSPGMVILRFRSHLQLRMGTTAQAVLKWAAAVRQLSRMTPSAVSGIAYIDLSGFPRLSIGMRP